VPKPHTPFQWMPLADLADVERRQRLLQERLRARGIDYNWTAPKTTQLEAALGRGDRRAGAVIEDAYRAGATFDAWHEYFRPQVWEQAFQAHGMTLAEYAARPRDPAAPLPWDHISVGVDKAYLRQECERALSGSPTPDCRRGCQQCGVLKTFAAQRRPLAKGVWQCP
jgi:hypothetical protein